jgi:hypothetical protein
VDSVSLAGVGGERERERQRDRQEREEREREKGERSRLYAEFLHIFVYQIQLLSEDLTAFWVIKVGYSESGQREIGHYISGSFRAIFFL